MSTPTAAGCTGEAVVPSNSVSVHVEHKADVYLLTLNADFVLVVATRSYAVALDCAAAYCRSLGRTMLVAPTSGREHS